ncbi:MAG: nucleotide exchange factor GrpE [Gallintestinimicrobium sp.]
MTGVAEERMEEKVKQDTSETETQEKRNTEECEETAEASAENTETPEDGETSEEKDKKGFFSGRKKEKKEDVVKAQINELQDKVMRQMAEFENFRKRSEKEKSAMFETGAKSVIEKILPVVDNFERGLATVPEDEKDAPFVDGMNKVYRQLLTELENLGVKPIEAVGKEFDPNFHNAVMQVENDELEPGTVAQELLKGYMYRDTVVRHSMVAVVQE